MLLWTILLVANIVFMATSLFYLYKIVFPSLKMMQEILTKIDSAAKIARQVAKDLEDSHLRAEQMVDNAPGEAADAAMQRPGNGNF